MEIVYEVVCYPRYWNDDLEEFVFGEVADTVGLFETESEAVEAIRMCNESAYIHKFDNESLLELWDDLWYYEDVLKGEKHPFDMP